MSRTVSEEKINDRKKAYQTTDSDVAAAEMVGESLSSFRNWRKAEGLAAKGRPGRQSNGNAHKVKAKSRRKTKAVRGPRTRRQNGTAREAMNAFQRIVEENERLRNALMDARKATDAVLP